MTGNRMFPLSLDDTANTYVGRFGLLPMSGVACHGGDVVDVVEPGIGIVEVVEGCGVPLRVLLEAPGVSAFAR